MKLLQAASRRDIRSPPNMNDGPLTGVRGGGETLVIVLDNASFLVESCVFGVVALAVVTNVPPAAGGLRLLVPRLRNPSRDSELCVLSDQFRVHYSESGMARRCFRFRHRGRAGRHQTPAALPHRKRSVSTKLYVGNIAFSTTGADLEQLFGQFGTVTSAQVVNDRETGRSRGFAFVEMSDGAQEAIKALNMKDFQGRSLTVNEAKPREDRPRGGGGYGGGGGGRRY